MRRALHTSRPLLLARRGAIERAPLPTSSSSPYVGATYMPQHGHWTSSALQDGKRVTLGTFSSAKDASDAYIAATSVFSASGVGRRRPRIGRTPVKEDQKGMNEEDTTTTSPKVSDSSPSGYIGVHHDPASGGMGMYEAVFSTADGREVSGGSYGTAEEAARAYDALSRMYLGEAGRTNFPVDPYTAWVPPEEVVHSGQIEVKPGVPLTVEEITGALMQERAIDVRVVPLAGRSDLAEHLVFATGRSVPHMRRMADMVARAQRKRTLSSHGGGVEGGGDGEVEGRDMDDWMVVDCGSVIVSVMDAEAREVFALEGMYEGMELGKDPYAGMTYDEWLVDNPIPEKWLQRLERDEIELEEAQRVVKGRSAGSARVRLS